MAQDGGNGSDGQSARDFLALSHGHEWTNFYDSFDKLVQDNLARSSELLRHAMSLPEVADREVAEIKAEMATKIAAERQQAKEAFSILHSELTTTQEQGEALQRSLTSWLGELSRIGDRVADLVTKYDAHDDAPAAEAVATEAEPVVEPVASEPELEPEPAFEWAAPESDPESMVEVVAEEPALVPAEAVSESETEAESESESDAFAAVVADSSENLDWESELSFDDVVGDGSAHDATAEEDSSEPQRPAWLSVAHQ